MKLTDTQREFASENHKLIYWFMNKNGLCLDEWYGAVAIGYVKAVATFDQEKANFTTYAYRCMSNQVIMENRKPQIPCVSLNETTRNLEGDDGSQFQDFIADDFDYAVDVEPFVDIESGLRSLPDKERRFLLMRLAGYQDAEIARRCSTSRAYVNNTVNRAKKKLAKVG